MKYILVVLCVICYFLPVDKSVYGYSLSSPLYTHISYIFFHKSILHLAINALAFLSLYKYINIKSVWFICFVLSGGILISFFSAKINPTIGLSGIVFILVGFQTSILSYKESNKLIPFLSLSLLSLTMGFIIPSVNGLIHFFGFSLGFFAYIIKSLIYESSIHNTRRE